MRRDMPGIVRIGCALVLLASMGSGCATGGGEAGVKTTVFVAPDGAKATPNTGSSRLADGGLFADVASSPAPGPAAAAVSADGVAFTWTGNGSAISVAGEFNAWDQAADPLVKQADGSFRLVKKLAPGRYAYKFVVDGQWQPDPAAKETVDDGFGGTNSVAVVGEGATAGATTGTAAPAAAAAAIPAGGGKGKAPEVIAEGVRFTFGGAARTVHLAGDFNAWSVSADPLTRGADGMWTITKALPSGTHAYKFVVDGTTWKTDDTNPNTIDDGFGGKNAVVAVP